MTASPQPSGSDRPTRGEGSRRRLWIVDGEIAGHSPHAVQHG